MVAAGAVAVGLVGNVLTVVVGLVLKLNPFAMLRVLVMNKAAMSVFKPPNSGNCQPELAVAKLNWQLPAKSLFHAGFKGIRDFLQVFFNGSF